MRSRNKDVFLLGACVTETDRQFYSPRVGFALELRSTHGEVLAEGGEAVVRRNGGGAGGGAGGGGGPHDISFK